MQRSESTLRETTPTPGAGRSRRGSITPLLPLLLLETLRDRDRPEEVLEDEDVSVSLPRRLGLSDVVMVQIRRFQEEVRAKRPQTTDQVIDLVRLVVRRPDAAEIFTEAGRRLANHAWAQRTSATRGFLRVMPNPVPRIAARRAARRMFKQIVGNAQLNVGRWPVEVRIRDALTARADPAGAACSLYSGAFVQIMELHTGKRYRVLHAECAARGEEACLWKVEVSG